MDQIRFLLVLQTIHISTISPQVLVNFQKGYIDCFTWLFGLRCIWPEFSIRTGRGLIAMQPTSSLVIFIFGRRQSRWHSKRFFSYPLALPMEPLWGEGYRERAVPVTALLWHGVTEREREREREDERRREWKSCLFSEALKPCLWVTMETVSVYILSSIEITVSCSVCVYEVYSMHYDLFIWIFWKKWG